MKYFLYSNGITLEPDDFVARVTQQETISYKELIGMATRRGLTLTDTELTSSFNEFLYTLNDVLSSGKAVDTPFVRFRPTIGGIFKGINDVFDPTRHYIKINCLPGKDITVDMNKIIVEKIKHESATPFIESVMDYSTLEENNVITPGGAAEIHGELLKIDMQDNLQGLFLNNNGSSVKVQTIIRNMPSDLIFNIPANMTAGEYQLEIRNKVSKKDTTLRNYLFPQLLTVK